MSTEDYLRRKHRQLPAHLRLKRGPVAYVGTQRPLATPLSVRQRLEHVARGGPLGPVTRQAYALGRAALMARWAAGDRWDTAVIRGGRGPLGQVFLPATWIRGWPKLECSPGAASRLAVEGGLALLEWQLGALGFVELLDERMVEIIAAPYHPERYCCPEAWTTEPEEEPGRSKSGATWLG